jgi:hypothetical protein
MSRLCVTRNFSRFLWIALGGFLAAAVNCGAVAENSPAGGSAGSPRLILWKLDSPVTLAGHSYNELRFTADSIGENKILSLRNSSVKKGDPSECIVYVCPDGVDDAGSCSNGIDNKIIDELSNTYNIKVKESQSQQSVFCNASNSIELERIKVVVVKEQSQRKKEIENKKTLGKDILLNFIFFNKDLISNPDVSSSGSSAAFPVIPTRTAPDKTDEQIKTIESKLGDVIKKLGEQSSNLLEIKEEIGK